MRWPRQGEKASTVCAIIIVLSFFAASRRFLMYSPWVALRSNLEPAGRSPPAMPVSPASARAGSDAPHKSRSLPTGFAGCCMATARRGFGSASVARSGGKDLQTWTSPLHRGSPQNLQAGAFIDNESNSEVQVSLTLFRFALRLRRDEPGVQVAGHVVVYANSIPILLRVLAARGPLEGVYRYTPSRWIKLATSNLTSHVGYVIMVRIT